jgi:hypothetical protein
MNILLIIALLLLFPVGGAQEMDADNSCGPEAVACIAEETNGSAFNSTVERVEAELAPWERLPEEIPYTGGATFPWGICHVMEKEGLKGRMLVGSNELKPGQEPFVALVREKQGWHYVAITEVRQGELVTNDGCQTTKEFLNKWRWSDYWRWQVEPIGRSVNKKGGK